MPTPPGRTRCSRRRRARRGGGRGGERLAPRGDSAGQNAMVKAAQVAAGRVQLRVVPLPAGTDPADLVARDGPDAMRALVERSIPFVQFQVERALELGDRTTAEGKDRVLAELRPAFAGLGPSLLRQELVGRVAEALDVPDELAASLLGSGRGPGPRAGRPPPPAPAGGPARPRAHARPGL